MATIELEGRLVVVDNSDYNQCLYLELGGESLVDHAWALRPMVTETFSLNTDYGRVRITIEQLDAPGAVAKRVVERHRGALDALGQE